MVKKIGDLSKAKIYRLKSVQTPNCYYGSTTLPLSIRKTQHKSFHKRWLIGKYHFVSSFEICKFPDIYIELVEDFPCTCKKDLLDREDLYISTDPLCINKNRPGRSTKEWQIVHNCIHKRQKGHCSICHDNVCKTCDKRFSSDQSLKKHKCKKLNNINITV